MAISIGAKLVGRIDRVAQPGRDARADDHRLDPQIIAAEPAELGCQRRDDAQIAQPCTARSSSPASPEQVADQRGVLVGQPEALGRQAPVGKQPLILIDAKFEIFVFPISILSNITIPSLVHNQAG